MVTGFRHGALAVVQATQPKERIDYLLRQIDPNLFCELQLTYDGDQVWCVVENVGGDQVPVTVLEFRDSTGEPIAGLTEQIVDRMRQRARILHESNDRSIAASAGRRADIENARKLERQEAESLANYTEAAAEYRRLIRRGNNAAVPRSAGLAASRRRARDRKARQMRAATGRTP